MEGNPLTVEWLTEHIQTTIDGGFNDDAYCWIDASTTSLPGELAVKLTAVLGEDGNDNEVHADRTFRVTVEELE